MNDYLYLYDSLVEKVQNVCKTTDPIILDIGSGPGILLKQIHQIFPQSHLIGLDRSIEMQMSAKKHRKDQSIHLIVADAEHLPIEDDTVDIVISRFSVCYWDDLKNAIKEIKRVLRPNGFGLFQLLNKDVSKFRLMMIKTMMKFHHTPPDVIMYHIDAFKIAYSPDEIIRVLEDSSLKINKVIGKRKDWMYTIIFQKISE